MPKIWAGIDAGKREHHCVVIDEAGKKLLSERVENDESVLLELIASVVDLADGEPVTWATDF
ncbi:IS110 family transposase, partial [Cryobacterium gelidum]